MMLAVVSKAAMDRNEANIINSLFDEGLDLFHLRKPMASQAATRRLLKKISAIHHPKIALHQHHIVADSYNVKRLHFPERHRIHSNDEELDSLKKQGCTLSTSIHDLVNTVVTASLFDYAFYGPVFNSISKKGYESIVPANFRVPRIKIKLVAIGGIDEHNALKTYQMGFHGLAVLGAIWQSSDPVHSFRKIKKTCSLIAP